LHEVGHSQTFNYGKVSLTPFMVPKTIRYWWFVCILL